ncbi:hypothetical protein J6590_014565 [Homalodisca vitripennis]|nr:hypothetical protein J6590_014565 [Homalodisca vitripennis]
MSRRTEHTLTNHRIVNVTLRQVDLDRTETSQVYEWSREYLPRKINGVDQKEEREPGLGGYGSGLATSAASWIQAACNSSVIT